MSDGGVLFENGGQTTGWRGPWSFGLTLAREGWKYFAVSAAALALDFGLLILLTERVHLPYLVSAAIGFSAGTLLAYVLSVSLVFRECRFTRRWAEFLGFVMIGVAGLVLNQILLRAFVEGLGLSYVLAKVPAAGIGFVFSFASRRLALFTSPAPRG
jgi:putative flippase GtrA